MPSKPKPLCRLLLLALDVSATACASNCPLPSSELPPLPPPPSQSMQQPPVSYSLSAEKKLQTWQQKLTATQMMQQPAAQPGQ